jgi:hypothetical protein
MYFTLLYFTFYGMMGVGITPNYHIASIVSTAFYNIWDLFSGFFIPRPVSAITLRFLFLLLETHVSFVFWTCFYMKKMPIWWRWYCWICPVAWTLYGLAVSQYGDITTPMEDGKTVKVFLEDYFDFKHSWLGWAAAIVVAFSVFFAALFAFAIMKLNFEKR